MESTGQRGLISEFVVPLDGSNRAEAAVPYAGLLARSLNAKITLVTMVAGMSGSQPELREKVQKSMSRSARQLEIAGLEAKTVTLLGDPPTALTRFANKNRTTAVVIAPRRKRRLGWRFGASVSDALLRSAKGPVVLVPASNSPSNLSRQARADSIIVPLDGRSDAERPLPLSKSLIEGLGADLKLVQVTVAESDDMSYLQAIERYFGSSAKMVSMQRKFGDAGREVANVVLKASDPLVVMCSESAINADGTKVGGIAGLVMRETLAPVMVVPPSA